MGLYEASFRVRHDCPYRDLSERHPDLTVREWYLRDCQVLELTSTRATDELLADVERLGTVLHETVDEAGVHVVTQSCECSLDESIIQRFEAYNCLYQPPTVYRQGWEHYTVVAFTERDVRALLSDLDADRDIEVLSKTALDERHIPHSMLIPVDQFFSDVTPRQLAALELALDNGYYEQPRQCSVAELAERTNVSRSTYEEHLRKAENKLLTNAGQFVRLLSARTADRSLRVDAA